MSTSFSRVSISPPLSSREDALLSAFLARPNRVLGKRWLAESLGAVDADIKPKSIEVYVHRLRKKVTALGVRIETVRDEGYVLTEAGMLLSERNP